MQIEIVDEGVSTLADYASISSAYQIFEVLDLDSPAAADSLLPYTSTTLAVPVEKDYDSLPQNHPLDWPMRFDVSSWGVLSARIGTRRVGGAIVVPPLAAAGILETASESALLWDIRVAPMARNAGVGTALLAAAEVWAKGRGAHGLTVETQNTNVPACRFYARAGFSLRDVRHGAYAELPGEVQIIWYKDLI